MAHSIQDIPYDFTVDDRYSPVYKRKLTQCTVIIPGGGCVYYRANKGDVCPFCAFPSFSRDVVKGPGHEDFYDKWTLESSIYEQMFYDSVNRAGSFEKLAIFNGGSFFPHSELPQQFQERVCKFSAKNENIKQLMVEAYPDFISEKSLRKTKNMLEGKDLMVGIGFESQNDFVRNTLLKKRIDKKKFESKIKLMQKIGVQVFVYAFLKAPGLTEQGALTETLRTIDYLSNLGVDEIALSSAFVPPGTLLEKQYHEGSFRPPWLWSILEIMEKAEQNKWPVSIGGFEDTPPPVAGPHNCSKCDQDVNNIIDCHRLNGHILQKSIPNCECTKTWHKEVAPKDIQLFKSTM